VIKVYSARAILIGHSLGGAAVLAAAADIPEVKAVVTIGRPAMQAPPADLAVFITRSHASRLQ
jgi:pimeloyl-ACP methyl ester carboxylesterase